MDTIELLNERPSDARRRLSAVFGAESEDAIALATAAAAAAARRRRVSVAPRRASAVSRVFALSSVSDNFAQEKLRPTLINAMIFLKNPNPDETKLRQVLAERLLCIPRFRSIPRLQVGGQVHFDPIPREEVDLNEHLKVIDGKHRFTESDIEQFVSKTFLTDWSPSRPLWRITLIKNLADGRSMLFIVIDHAIGDGVGLLSLCLSLFDDPPTEKETTTSAACITSVSNNDCNNQSKTKKTSKGKNLSWSHLACSFFFGIYDGIVNTLNPPLDAASALTIPKTELLNDCPGKSLAQTRAIPLAEVKDLKNKMAGTTLNDIVLAVIAMAIRKYFETTKDPALDVVLKGKGKIRGDMPVNMRRRGSEGMGANVGNNFCLAAFVFPVNYTDPIDAVWKCKAAVDELKVSPAFYLRKVLADVLFGKGPETILASKVLDLMNRSTCMISNVKGPTDTAYFGGYAIDDLNFTTSYLGGLYCGILTFGGNLRVSLILDNRTRANAKQLRDCFESAYDELKDALMDVDAAKPLEMPDMTPISARVFELLVYAAVVTVPICIAMMLLQR
jgi:diacylglycerol O-acyltransferase / wax synthase